MGLKFYLSLKPIIEVRDYQLVNILNKSYGMVNKYSVQNEENHEIIRGYKTNYQIAVF